MSVFATKVWGLSFEKWPILTFPTEGYRQAFINKAATIDGPAFVCFVATKGQNTEEENRGRILGIAECGTAEVNAESVLLKINNGKRLSDKNYDGGIFKWRFGLSLKRAWYFPDKPLAIDVLQRPLKWSSVRGCEQLTPDEGSRVLKLSKRKALLPEAGLDQNEIGSSRKVIRSSRSRGILPTVSGYHVTRKRMPASVYVLNFKGTDVFKVGWAFDVESRCIDINQHVPHEVITNKWELYLWQRFEDQFAAFAMEQSLLRGPLKPYVTVGERIRQPSRDLRQIWSKHVTSALEAKGLSPAVTSAQVGG